MRFNMTPRCAFVLVLFGLCTRLCAFELQLPVACDLGDNCWIQNHVDHDPGPGTRDVACQSRSYDGHKGTDFRLATRSEIGRVAVFAAAPGVIRGVRDGEPDAAQGEPGAPDVTGRECGNGVVIDHGQGWETQYCHMARGSISVAPGAQVAAGEALGMIGLSGRTEFPHLHLSVRKDGAVVDPFAGPCGTAQNLWADDIPYGHGGLLASGFATRVPEYSEIRAGPLPDKPDTGLPLVLWTHAFGVATGDEIVLRIEGPKGEVIRDVTPLSRDRATEFRAAGRRAPEGGWAPGTYRGTVELRRGAVVVDRAELEISLGAAPTRR